jgi:hypothetical protein
MTPKRLAKMRITPHHVFEKLGRAYLTAAKAALLAAAIATFLPMVFRAALRHFIRHAARTGPLR